MLIAAHINKFRRLDRTKARLDAEADCELWIWTSMNAATHLLNAALHHVHLTEETDSFHSQVEGLYWIPDRRTGALSDAMHAPGDVMHFGQPRLRGPIPAAIERAGAALKVIEALRGPYVRGSDPIPPGATQQWERSYRQCVAELSALLGTQLGEAD
jgi:hypothetical protein